MLTAAARDKSALVRAEAVKAAVSFEGLAAAEILFEVATRPTDPELDTVLDYARGVLNVDKLVQDAVGSGKPLSKATQAYALRNASVDDLLKLPRTEAVYEAILNRQNATAEALREALGGLAGLRKTSSLPVLLTLIEDRDSLGQADALAGLAQLLAEQPIAELRKVRTRIENLAVKGKLPQTRQLGYVAWMVADGSGDAAFFSGAES